MQVSVEGFQTTGSVFLFQMVLVWFAYRNNGHYSCQVIPPGITTESVRVRAVTTHLNLHLANRDYKMPSIVRWIWTAVMLQCKTMQVLHQWNKDFPGENSSFSPNLTERMAGGFPPTQQLFLPMTILFQNQNWSLGFCLITTAQGVLKPKATSE